MPVIQGNGGGLRIRQRACLPVSWVRLSSIWDGSQSHLGKNVVLSESLILKSQRTTVVFGIPATEVSECDLRVIKLHSNPCRQKAMLVECHEKPMNIH